jgi:formate dehydrogenase subunit gamma
MSHQPVVRHQLPDRLLHWLLAFNILILLLTGLLPKLGINFAWLELHWISGLLLVLLSLVHLLRVLAAKPLLNMWVSLRDLGTGKPGKFSLPQKLMHNAVAVVTLTALVTGLLMLVRIDTPLWTRDPYWLSAATWGVVYVLHGLVALVFTSIIMLHVYFSLRPEKRLYLRSIVKGWITRAEYEREHDPDQWKL